MQETFLLETVLTLKYFTGSVLSSSEYQSLVCKCAVSCASLSCQEGIDVLNL
jgi:hypothetical protein